MRTEPMTVALPDLGRTPSAALDDLEWRVECLARTIRPDADVASSARPRTTTVPYWYLERVHEPSRLGVRARLEGNGGVRILEISSNADAAFSDDPAWQLQTEVLREPLNPQDRHAVLLAAGFWIVAGAVGALLSWRFLGGDTGLAWIYAFIVAAGCGAFAYAALQGRRPQAEPAPSEQQRAWTERVHEAIAGARGLQVLDPPGAGPWRR